MTIAGPLMFISTSGTEGVENVSARKLIRQRASIYGARGRAGGRPGRKPRIRRMKIDFEEDYALVRSIPTAYELARARFDVDVGQIAFLVGFEIGLDTKNVLSNGRSELPAQSSQWSYLDFVPSRYGQDVCLTAATDCLLHTIACLTGLRHDRHRTVKLYMDALRELQRALDDPSLNQTSEVFCAAHLLSVYEFLTPTCRNSWLSHMKGTSSLMRHRLSSSSSWTDFDRALLAAHIGPAVYQSFHDTTPCYLEQPEWQQACQSLSVDDSTISHRNRLVMEMQLCAIETPGIWKDLHGLMITPTLDDDTTRPVLERLRKSYRHHQYTLARIRRYLGQAARKSPPHDVREDNLQREAYRYTLQGNIVNSRLLSAIDAEGYEQLSQDARSMIAEYLSLQPQESLTWLAYLHEQTVIRGFLHDHYWTDLDESLSLQERKEALRNMYLSWIRAIRPDLPGLAGSRMPETQTWIAIRDRVWPAVL